MKRRSIAIGAICFSCFDCGNGSADSAPPEDTKGNLLAGRFESEDDFLPDCSPLLGQLRGNEPDPGVNCIERRLYWWLGGAKATFSAAAIIEIGDEVLDKDIDLTDALDTDLAPIHPGFLTDSNVETVIYGEIPTGPLLSCYEYGTMPTDAAPTCGSGFGESWYVCKGRALAFFGDDCILQTYNGSCASIYRLYPISDEIVFDYDGSGIALEDVLILIGSGGDEWRQLECKGLFSLSGRAEVPGRIEPRDSFDCRPARVVGLPGPLISDCLELQDDHNFNSQHHRLLKGVESKTASGYIFAPAWVCAVFCCQR